MFSPGHRPQSDFYWQMPWNVEDLQKHFILKCMGNCYHYYCKSGIIEKMTWIVRETARTLDNCFLKMNMHCPSLLLYSWYCFQLYYFSPRYHMSEYTKPSGQHRTISLTLAFSTSDIFMHGVIERAFTEKYWN